MGIFGKKKSEEVSLPDLPENYPPNLSEYNDPSNDLNSYTPSMTMPVMLPQLPDYSNQQIQQPLLQPLPFNDPFQNEKFTAEPMGIPNQMGISNFQTPLKNVNMQQRSKAKINEPIYVRLDKFESSVHAFDEIKIKIQEMEDILAKTKAIRESENQEIEEWEKEIMAIKLKLESINRDIFSKFD